MKILNPFRFYRGAWGDDAPTPALTPPKYQSLLKSISVAECLDVLCEGPIYGLVDQFGKKVYGLDMLKGVYLNNVPVMNSDGKYNFRNIVMEINLGTENQKPLQNFKNVNIWKQGNFKLLGPITTENDVRSDPNGGKPRDFTGWAAGWPMQAKDPFVFVHHVRNQDVKRVKISLIIEALFDTVDTGDGPGKQGHIGTSKSTDLTISVSYGVEGTNKIFVREYNLYGTIQSPYACMLGDPVPQLQGNGISFNSGAVINTRSSSIPIGTIGTRVVVNPVVKELQKNPE